MTNEEVIYELETNIDYKTEKIKEACQMAIRSLEAWGKVKDEIEEWHNKRCTSLTWNNYKVITEIIDKHLREVEE